VAVLSGLFDGTPRAELAHMIRDWRMERASDRLQSFTAGARLLAKRLDKGDVIVEIPRSNLRLQRERWAGFWGAFTHVVRNAIDHGLEAEAERNQQKASAPATLRLSATQRGTEVVIEATDNGRGIDWERLAERASRLGMPHASREDLIAALFADGVTTRDDVTHVSGRGVGLAAAKEACDRMGGYVRVDSHRGRGTTFSFHMPVDERKLSVVPPRTSQPVASNA
jgi:two-component system chemotaxis sensor kinase CheA